MHRLHHNTAVSNVCQKALLWESSQQQQQQQQHQSSPTPPSEHDGSKLQHMHFHEQQQPSLPPHRPSEHNTSLSQDVHVHGQVPDALWASMPAELSGECATYMLADIRHSRPSTDAAASRANLSPHALNLQLQSGYDSNSTQLPVSGSMRGDSACSLAFADAPWWVSNAAAISFTGPPIQIEQTQEATYHCLPDQGEVHAWVSPFPTHSLHDLHKPAGH